MDGITAAHVVKILLYVYKQSHYTTTYFFWRNFANWRQKKNPVQPLRRNLKKELPEHSQYFLEKKD
jgi:hypothetical protein